MKQLYTLFFIFCNIYFISAQTGNVGIGTSTPDGTTKLDISATDKGILIPRVTLTALNAIGPITNALGSAASNANMQDGLMVYNTATAGSSPNTVTPGYYYWDKSNNKWVRVGNSKDNDWTVANTAATPAIKTDNQYVTGNVGVGDFSTKNPLNKLHILHTSNTDGLLLQNNTGGASATTNINFATYADIVAGTSRPGASIKAIDNGDYSANLTFSTKTPGADINAMTERMRIQSGGNIGINSTNIDNRLDVNGNIGVEGNNVIEFGDDVAGKESNAGKMGYQTFTTGALDIVGAGISGTNRLVKLWDNAVIQNNLIAGSGLISGKIEIQLGPNTGADGQYHRVQLSTGFAGSAFSAYATGSYLDGDVKMQGVDIAPLLSNTSSWYIGNANSVNIGTSNGQTCDNCTHACNCPDGYIATGWEAYAASQLDTYMKLKCTQLNTGFTTVETGIGVESVSSFPNNIGDNITHVSTCPAGTFIKGIAIYANSYLDGNLRVFCTGIKKN